MSRRRLAGIAVLAAFLTASRHEARAADRDLAPERRREILRDSLNAFDEAVAITRTDSARAERRYRKAAAGFSTLLEAGLRNAALEYNLANTHFRLGELGRAVLHYRRGQRIDPSDKQLAANLDYARNRVEPYIAPSGQRRLAARVLFWHYTTSPRFRLTFAAICSLLGWLALLAWLARRTRALALAATVLIALGIANGASLAWQLQDEARHPHAVVIDGEHILRLGRGEAYDPALRQPLGPGVELRVLNERAAWVEVRLPNGQTGWLPISALERV